MQKMSQTGDDSYSPAGRERERRVVVVGRHRVGRLVVLASRRTQYMHDCRVYNCFTIGLRLFVTG